MLGRGIEKPADLAAARKMLADRAQHDDPHAIVGVGRFEGDAQLLALVHRDDVERRPIEDDVEPLPRRIDLDAKPVEPARFRRGRAAPQLTSAGLFRVRAAPASRPAARDRVLRRVARIGHGLAPLFGAAAAFRRRGSGSSRRAFRFSCLRSMLARREQPQEARRRQRKLQIANAERVGDRIGDAHRRAHRVSFRRRPWRRAA